MRKSYASLVRRLVFCIAVIAAIGIFQHWHAPAMRVITVNGTKVTVWMPQGAWKNRPPVVIFSHSFHGCATQSLYLINALIQNGYAVVAPNHRDASCYGGASPATSPPEVSFDAPDHWTSSTYEDRRHDIEAILDHLPHEEATRHFDWNNVGFVGYSLGGYTGLGLAGAWPDWKDRRIKALVVYSPFRSPFMVHHTLGNISIPVMYQGATDDLDINRGHATYDETPMPKYYLELNKANHFAWNGNSPYADVINPYTLAFLNHYMLSAPFDVMLLDNPPLVKGNEHGLSTILSQTPR